LEAACSHETLESVEHNSSQFGEVLEESIEALLGRILQKTTSLKHMQLKSIRLSAGAVDQLAFGISYNQTLETF
jgi:hypothetical protein